MSPLLLWLYKLAYTSTVGSCHTSLSAVFMQLTKKKEKQRKTYNWSTLELELPNVHNKRKKKSWTKTFSSSFLPFSVGILVYGLMPISHLTTSRKLINVSGYFSLQEPMYESRKSFLSNSTFRLSFAFLSATCSVW